MINPANNKIIVRVDMRQKDTMTVGDVTVSTAMKYEVNYREKSPTVACVVEGNEWVKENDILLCHHNMFYHPSPFYLYDDLFSIPAGKTIFSIVKEDGSLQPIYGNIICDRVFKDLLLPLPPDKREKYTDRVIVTNKGYTQYNNGDLLFHRPHAAYDIVYIWNGIESRVTKIPEDQVCGILKKFK